MGGPYTLADVRSTYKKRDAWWTVLLVDPIAGRLVVPVANRTSLTPNQLTLLAALLGAGAVGAFAEGSRTALIVGAALFYLSFVVDCMDGKIARLKGTGTIFGTWLDYVLDRVKVAACAVALMTGQFVRTDRVIFLYLAMLVLFAEMVRYIDVSRIRDTRAAMARKIRSAARQAIAIEEAADDGNARDLGYRALVADAAARSAETSDGDASHVWDPAHDDSWTPSPILGYRQNPLGVISQDFGRRFVSYERFRAMLLRRRIRTHLWSGIEFEMFVFVVGPLTGAIVEVTIASAALLLAFELAIIYKLWLSTKNFARVMRELETLAPPQGQEPQQLGGIAASPESTPSAGVSSAHG